MKDLSKLEVFSHGFLQDALTLMKVMKRENLTEDDICEYLKSLFDGTYKKKDSSTFPKNKDKKSSQMFNGVEDNLEAINRRSQVRSKW